MNIKNYLTAPKKSVTHQPGGTGIMHYSRVWDKIDFLSKWNFVDHVILPPGASIGAHTHGNDEEMYIILSGCGTMTVDGEQKAVSRGDMVLNRPQGNHGLRNNSDADLEMLVVEIAV